MRLQLVRSIPLITVCCLTLGFAAAPEMSLVQVRNGQIRGTPSYLGKIVTAVPYGEKVTVVQKNGEWIQVSTASKTIGWIHSSALSIKKVKMTAGTQTTQTGASGDELALAGKGFNKDIEADFKAKNASLDYTSVDAMEAEVVTPQGIAKFTSDGELRPLP